MNNITSECIETTLKYIEEIAWKMADFWAKLWGNWDKKGHYSCCPDLDDGIKLKTSWYGPWSAFDENFEVIEITSEDLADFEKWCEEAKNTFIKTRNIKALADFEKRYT